MSGLWGYLFFLFGDLEGNLRVLGVGCFYSDSLVFFLAREFGRFFSLFLVSCDDREDRSRESSYFVGER